MNNERWALMKQRSATCAYTGGVSIDSLILMPAFAKHKRN